MLSAVATIASSFERGFQSRTRFAFSFEAFFALPSSETRGLSDESKSAPETHEPIGKDTGRDALRGFPHSCAKDERHGVDGHGLSRDRQEPLPTRRRIRHGAQMHVGHVPNVHDAEGQLWRSRHCAVHEAVERSESTSSSPRRELGRGQRPTFTTDSSRARRLRF